MDKRKPIPQCPHCHGPMLPNIEERGVLTCLWCGRSNAVVPWRPPRYQPQIPSFPD